MRYLKSKLPIANTIVLILIAAIIHLPGITPSKIIMNKNKYICSL